MLVSCITGRESVSWSFSGSGAAALPALESFTVTRATCPKEEAVDSGALTSSDDADALPPDMRERIRISTTFPVKRTYHAIWWRFPAFHWGYGANRWFISTHTIDCMSTFNCTPTRHIMSSGNITHTARESTRTKARRDGRHRRTRRSTAVSGRRRRVKHGPPGGIARIDAGRVRRPNVRVPLCPGHWTIPPTRRPMRRVGRNQQPLALHGYAQSDDRDLTKGCRLCHPRCSK